MTDSQMTEQDGLYNGLKNWKAFTESRYNKKILKEDKIPGGAGDKANPESLSKKYNVTVEEIEKEIAAGIKVEMEHTKDATVAREIVMDHLTKDGLKYYKELSKMEDKLDEEKKKSIIRPNLGSGATPPESVNGPGTVSPTSTAVGPAPGTAAPAAALEESKKLVKVAQGSPRNNGTSTTAPSRQVHADVKKKSKHMDSWKKDIKAGKYDR